MELQKGPYRCDIRSTGFDKSKKSIFELQKGPCGHDIWIRGLEQIIKFIILDTEWVHTDSFDAKLVRINLSGAPEAME